MKDVLFICQGNVGRSQMAEGYYNAMAGEALAISAGIDDVAVKYNGHPTPEIVAVMSEDGIDVSQQIIKQIKTDMTQDVKHIVVLCRDNPPTYITKNPKTIFAPVEDPFNMGIDGTRQVRDNIKRIVEGMRRDGLTNPQN